MISKPPVLPANYVPYVHHGELVKALRQIQHATSPTHDDGAFHENAYTVATEILNKVDAYVAYSEATS